MRWLTREQAQEACATNRSEPQLISVAADVAELWGEIPVVPDLIGSDQGAPSPVNRWYGCIGNRVFSVEAQAHPRLDHSSVALYTPFLEQQSTFGDWAVLLELRPLPKPIHVSRPLFIESRNQHPTRVVYRPDPQGWNSVLYKAASKDDADRLMSFLSTDAWNQSCFVGDPEPAGEWVVCQGEEVIGRGGCEFNQTLRVACKWSLRYPRTKVVVKDISGLNSAVFRIEQGRVLDALK
jgi:hypothetical protein